MTPYIMTLTQGGLAAIVNVQAGTIGPVVISQIGLTDATFTVASTLEVLPGEIKRVDVSGDTLGDDLVHVIGLDNSTDAYGYRGFALYTSTGLLFAVYGQAEPIAQKTSGSASYIVLDIAMARGQSDAITFGDTNFLNPPASTDQGVVELATTIEAQEGVDALRAITPSTAKASVLAWIGFAPLAAASFTKAAILGLLGYVPFDSAGFTGAAVKAVLGYTPLDAAAFTKAAILGLLGYTPQDAAASISGSNDYGYWERRPNGILEQWGAVTAGETNNPSPLTFPQPFVDMASVALTVSARSPNTGATSGNKVDGEVLSTTQFTVSSDDGNVGVFWRAIGKGA